MRVAIIAGSMAIAIRVAKEIENLPTVDVSIVLCNLRMRPPLLRWARELLLALKSFQWLAFAGRVYDYVKARKLMILRRPLDDSISTERLRSLQCDVGLHAANVIYREPTISAFRLGILNAHIGILPKYRGRCVAEWSILQGDSTGVTVFLSILELTPASALFCASSFHRTTRIASRSSRKCCSPVMPA